MIHPTPHFRLYGIAFRLHPSWLLLAFLLLAGNLILAPRWTLTTASVAIVQQGALTLLILFSSVLLHEGAHLAIGRHYQQLRHPRTLYYFGSVPDYDGAATQPRGDLFTTLAGPFGSVIIAGITALLWWQWRGSNQQLYEILLTIIITNVGLGVFTLLPGYPLDGGRLVRIGLYYLNNDLLAATRQTTFISQLIALAAIGIGALLFLQEQFYLAFLLFCGGAILSHAAHQSYRQLRWQIRSKEIPTIHAAFLNAPLISSDRHLDDVVDDLLDGLGPHNEGGPSLVIDATKHPIGVLGLEQLQAIKRRQWAATTAGEAMIPIAALPFLPADLPLDQALATCTGGRYSYALVVAPEQGTAAQNTPIGIVTPKRIVRCLDYYREPAPSEVE